MATNLLQTKLRPPAFSPQTIPRPQLVAQLNAGLAAGRRLTLISAPAGFGKTTTAAAWLAVVDRPVAWLALDLADDDPARFFCYLTAALQTVDERIGASLASVLRGGQAPPADAISASLINDMLAVDDPFLLVLDDVQHLQDETILAVLQTVISNPPPALHLVLLTREDPALPLARLRAAGQLTELRAADLRFSREEVAAFLEQALARKLAPTELTALESKTEGWAAGLQLAALSLRDHPQPEAFIAGLRGTHRHILSYLTEEVLAQQPAEIQSFLLQTAWLDRMSGPLADAVTGRDDSTRILARLVAENLFVTPLDETHHWFRYHALFADLLRDRQRARHPEETAELHRRASAWYAAAGQPTEAIDHALAAEDYASAIRLIEEHAMDMLMAWHARTVDRWLQAIPETWTANSPRLNLTFAWLYPMSGRFAEAGQTIDRLQRLAAAGAFADASPDLQAEWLALQANLLAAQGKLAEALALYEQALALAPEGAEYARTFIYTGLADAYKQLNEVERAVAAYEQLIEHGRAARSLVSELMGVSALALYAMERGELQRAYDLARAGLARAEQAGAFPPIVAAVIGELGGVHYHRYEVAEAHHYLSRATELSTLSGYSDSEIYHAIIRSRLAEIDGDVMQAAGHLDDALALAKAFPPAAIRDELLHQRVRVALAQGQTAAARTLLNRHGLDADHALTALDPARPLDRETGLLAVAALRLAIHELEATPDAATGTEALSFADALLETARAANADVLVLETLLLRARLLMTLGDSAAAQETVAKALALAAPERFVTIFLLEGEPIARLVGALRKAEQLPPGPDALAVRILAAQSPPRQPNGAPQSDFYDGTLAETLSPRELEVLRLIDRGYSNQSIADELSISLHTVKKHSSNIYSKLGTSSRTQATARARELGLLTS